MTSARLIARLASPQLTGLDIARAARIYPEIARLACKEHEKASKWSNFSCTRQRKLNHLGGKSAKSPQAGYRKSC